MSGGLFGLSDETSGKRRLPRRLQKHENWVDAILPADADAGVLETETSRKPLLIIAAFGLAMMAVLVARLASLQIVNGDRNLGLADGNRIRQQVTQAPRGAIYDRNHNLLVRNEASFDVSVVPQELPKTAQQRAALYQKLGSLLGMSPTDIQQKAESKGLNQLQPQLIASGLDRNKALLMDQDSSGYEPFSLDVNPVRQYLDNGMLSQILGYTGRVSQQDLAANPSYLPTDYIGKQGIEKQYENVLKGVDGRRQTEVDAAGRPIKVLADEPSQPGYSLVLSIDEQLEQHLSDSLKHQMDLSGSTEAAAVALDPRNGQVLASVSLPTYDDNLFANGISQADYTKLVTDPAQPLFDKAISGAYPSGSIIKPLVASAALQEHIITPSTTIVDTGKLTVTNKYNPSITYTYYGWEHSGLGVMNVESAIAMSSDIFFYTVVGGFGNFVGLGIDKLADYYHLFGLGQPTGIDLPNDSLGRVPTPAWKEKTYHQPWYTGDSYNVSVGQGDILVSPLQMAVAIGAVANGGTLYQPQLVHQVLDDQGNVVKTMQPKVVRQGFISPQNLDIVRAGMRQTVQSGTACCFFDKQVPVQVAGKTGTAETDPAAHKKPDAWFVAFAPYQNPRIVVVVFLREAGEGAQYAAPVARETLAWYFSQPGN